MLALAEWRAGRCPRCSEPLHESTSIENDDAYTTTAVRCHACTAVARAHKDDDKREYPGAVMHIPKLTPRG